MRFPAADRPSGRLESAWLKKFTDLSSGGLKLRIFIHQANVVDSKQKAIQTKSNNHSADKTHPKLTSNLATVRAWPIIHSVTLDNTLRFLYFSSKEFHEEPVNDKIESLQI